mmetsp:Transcript_15785/g.26652  ORF Transcript_15785/g.26652 Transcript_15785/m.26652 type:complete len:119 (+) Transcript_15785:252-608(+)
MVGGESVEDTKFNLGTWVSKGNRLAEAEGQSVLFDSAFENNRGKAVLITRPLFKELQVELSGGYAQEDDGRESAKESLLEKDELTVGLMDGEFASNLDFIHFNKQLVVLPGKQMEFRN